MRLGFACAVVLLTAAPAFASANVSCHIDDRVLEFEFEAIAGRTSPINQIQHATITVKPAAALKLTKPKVEVKLENLVQQWLFDGDLRLQIQAYDEPARENLNLVVVAQLNRKTEKYAGRYVLTVTSGGNDKVLSGRIKFCEAG